MPITSDHENGFAVSANELTGIRLQRSVVRSGNPKAHVLPSAKDSKTGRIEYTFTNQAALDKTLAAIKEWREPKQETPKTTVQRTALRTRTAA